MTTIAYNQAQSTSISGIFGHYNKYALLSMVCAILFISYFFLPHNGVFSPVFQFNVFFIVFVPLIGLALSVIGVRQISRNHDRGLLMSYFALGVTGLYFMVALAIPFVLIGLYFIYSYIM